MNVLKRASALILALGTLCSQCVYADFVDSTSYDKDTGVFTVSGESDRMVNVSLLKAGLGMDSLKNVSNENNPFLSIDTAHAQNGKYTSNFKKPLESGKNYMLIVSNGEQKYTEVVGDSHKIYVSNTKSSDNYAGTEERPVKTVEKAAQLAKEYKAKNPFGNIEIIIRGGTYTVSTPIVLNSDNSGSETCRITYRAADGEKVVFSGASKLSNSKFTSVTDSAVLNKIPDAARENVRVFDLNANGINAGKIKFQLNPSTLDLVPPELYFNGKKQSIAQWPDSGYKNFDSISEDKLSFTVPEDKLHKWQNETDAYIRGYIEEMYYRQSARLTFDESKTMIKLPTIKGLRDGGKYEIVNALSELDMPGEWYADSENGKLYFYPPNSIKSSDTIELSTYNNSFIKIDGAKYITIKDICFEKSNVPAAYQADASNPAISARNADKVIIDGVTVRNCAGGGILLSGSNSEIKNCTVYNMGGKGIMLSGGDVQKLISGGNRASHNYTYNLCEYQSPHAAGNSLSGVGNVMKNNVFHRSDGSLFGYSGTECKILNNEFYNGTIEIKDSGLVYSAGSFISYGNEIMYNYFHDMNVPNDNFPNDTPLNNSLYWDNLLSGQTAKYNIIKAGKGIQRSFLDSGCDNTFESNTVIDGDAVLFADWTSYYWGIGGEKYTLHPIAERPYQTILTVDHANSPWIDKYPQVNRLYNELTLETDSAGNVTKYGLFYPENNVTRNNFMVNTNSEIHTGVTKHNGTNEGNIIFGEMYKDPYDKTGIYDNAMRDNTVNERLDDSQKKSIFVDYDNQDYRVTSQAKQKYNIPDEILSEDNFDINDIGTERELTDTEFSLIYPKTDAVENTSTALKWEQSDFTDKYRYVIAKDKNLSDIVKEGETFEETVDITGLDKNTTYYWTVYAINSSRVNHSEWQTNSGVYSFTTNGNDVIVKSSSFKAGNSEFSAELDIDNLSYGAGLKAVTVIRSSDGALKQAVTNSVSLSEGESIYSLSGKLECDISDSDTAEILLWNSFDIMKPLSGKVSIKSIEYN